MKKIILTLMCVIVLFTGSLTAAPLNQAHVPANAGWLIHFDVDTFSQTEMWWLISREMTEKQQQKIDEITALLGSDPTKDIFGLTLYGPDADEKNAVLMLYGWFNREKLLGLLLTNPAYAETEYQGQKLYHWFDENDNQDKTGTFAADNLIVISQSEKAVKQTIDVLAGRAKSLADQPDVPLTDLVRAPDDAFMILAADGIAELAQKNKHTAMLQKSQSMTATLGEKEGQLYLLIDLNTHTGETASQVEQMLLGIKAFIEMKHEYVPEIISLLKATDLERDDNELSLTFQYPSAALFEMAEDLRKLHHKAKKFKPAHRQKN